MRANIPKDGFGDEIVRALGQPPAALVAASEMEPERDTRVTCDHRVVQFDSMA